MDLGAVEAARKFKVGQIVCTKRGKEQPFRIIEVLEEEHGTYYKWNRRNAMADNSVRALTPSEIGAEDSTQVVLLREQSRQASIVITKLCQIMDVVKQDWEREGCWSDWNQSQCDAASTWLKAFYEETPIAEPVLLREQNAELVRVLQEVDRRDAIEEDVCGPLAPENCAANCLGCMARAILSKVKQ